MTEETELPVAKLPDRYQVARSQVYARMDALKQRDPRLVPFKRGRKAYASRPLLEALDSMHVLIQKGETVAEAADRVLGIPPQTRPDNPVGQLDRTQDNSEPPSDLMRLVQAIAGIKQPQPSRLARYRELEEIAIHGWRLPTSELADILEVKTLSGKSFARYGFRFTRAGKAGGESTWKVEKL